MKSIRFISIIVVIIFILGGIVFGIVRVKNNTFPLKKIGKVPEFSFVNQNGVIITNNNYIGKIYVIDFFFTSCPSICPMMTHNLVQVQNFFKENDKIAFASFSIDPEQDTPEILREYAKNHGITNPNWNLLTADQETVMNLANKGFNIYAAVNDDEDGGFEHSGKMALIDSQGNIVSRKDKYGNPIVYYDGLSDEGIQQLIEDISLLLQHNSL